MCQNFGLAIKDSLDPAQLHHKSQSGSTLTNLVDPLRLKDGMTPKPPPAAEKASVMDPRIDASPETLSSQLEKKKKPVLADGEAEASNSNVLATAKR